MRIALYGASGRMGRAIAALAGPEIAFAISHAHSPSLGKDLGELLGRARSGICVQVSFDGDADLLIDVSLSKAFPVALETALKMKKPIVIGVTGLSPSQMQQIESAARAIPVFYAPNFSLGMAVLRRMAAETARRFPTTAIDIVETHHMHKKDAPSGSALSLARSLLPHEARIHSVRTGDVIGEHRLLFQSEGETVELSHSVQNRDVFARGALSTARFLVTKEAGLYSMDDIV